MHVEVVRLLRDSVKGNHAESFARYISYVGITTRLSHGYLRPYVLIQEYGNERRQERGSALLYVPAR